jgi:hypothetical protein
MTTFIPTHTCFDDALELCVWLATGGGVPTSDLHSRYRVVHGICWGRDVSERFVHAWVEEASSPLGSLAWQAAIADGRVLFYALPLADFRALWRVESELQYTLDEVGSMVLALGHAGPWEPGYHAFASGSKNEGRVMGRMTGLSPVAMLYLQR